MTEDCIKTDAPTSYSIRDGTIDYGKDYEVKMAAFMSLRCILQKTVLNTWLVLNADRCGAFDDLVFCVETTDGRNLNYLIQLKHGMEGKDIPEREFKTKKKGDFLVEKYYKTILEIETAIDKKEDTSSEIINHLRRHHDEIVFVLFTNRGTTECEFLRSVTKKSEIDLRWSLYHFVDSGGHISLFDYNALEMKVDDKVKSVMEDRFFLFTNQIHIDKLDGAIETAIGDLVKPVKLEKKRLREITHRFIAFVEEWSKGELGDFYPLTKNHIFRVLSELTLVPNMVQIEESQMNHDLEMDMWKGIIEDKTVTLVDGLASTVQFLHRYLHGEINTYQADPKNNNLWKKHPHKIRKLISRVVERAKQIRTSDAYECLWKNNQVPLLLQAKTSEQLNELIHVLKTYQNKFSVIILAEEPLKTSLGPKSFSGIRDLSQEHQQKILEMSIHLQGRSSITLSGLVKLKLDAIVDFITVKNVIQILTNTFTVGDGYAPLPEIFLNRSLERVELSPDVLDKVTQELFLIKCRSNHDFQILLEKHDLTIDESRVSRWQNKSKRLVETGVVLFESESTMEQINNFGLTRNKVTHVLELHKGKLEWLKSFGSVQNIAPFRLTSDLRFGQVDEVLKHCSNNKVTLISACPGMGKSTLIDYIALHAPTDFWVLKINLLDHVDYYKSRDFEKSHLEPLKHLRYFHDQLLSTQKCNVALAKIVFDRFLVLKKILVLLDGFDEIPVTCQNGAKEMLKSLSRLKLCMYITTRPVFKTDLETLLGTFAVTINPFTKQDQLTFLKKYFLNALGVQNLEHIQSFVGELLDAAQLNLNDQDQEFMDVPLQTKLLAEVFIDSCTNFVETQEFQEKHFDLLYLYQHFIQQKAKIFCTKFGHASEDMLTHYTTHRSFYALRLLFPPEDLQDLNIETQIQQVMKVFPDTVQLIQKDGIVVGENELDLRFVHRTFAEYLTAQWLADNISGKNGDVKHLLRKIFEPTYTVVRNILDRILAKGCPFHLAIINRRIDQVEEIMLREPSVFTIVDSANRSYLHLIAAWSVYHPHEADQTDAELDAFRKTISNDTMTKILKSIPNDKLSDTKDNLLDLTPLDYAILSGSLNVADEICARLPNVDLEIFYQDDKYEYLTFYAGKIPYFSLIPVIDKQHSMRCVAIMFTLQTIAEQAWDDYLRQIAVSGDVKNLSLLISNSPNINQQDTIGCTILHLAVMYGRVIMVSLLLSAGANPNIPDQSGYTPLHWAVIKCHTNIFNLLLSEDIDVDARDFKGRTALHLAVILGNGVDRNAIISSLLEKNAQITIEDAQGKTALRYAAEFRQNQVVALILDYRPLNSDTTTKILATQDQSALTIFHWVTIYGYTDILSLLLPYSTDILYAKDINGKTVLHWSAERDHLQTLNAILSEKTAECLLGATDNSGMTPLHLSAWNGHTKTTSALLSKKAMMEAKDDFNRTPLICAAQNGHINVVSLLVTHGAQLEATGERNRTALIAAARDGHMGVVKLLITKGANIEAVNDENMSALHWAASTGRQSLVRLLLELKADFTQKDVYGRSPLLWAAHGGSPDVMALLLDKEANINETDFKGYGLGHLAAMGGHVKVTELLQSKGVDFEVKNEDEMTALHLASWNGHLEVVSLLLSFGVALEPRNFCGRTALVCAAFGGYTEIVQLLLSHQANLDEKDIEEMTALHWASWNGHALTAEVLVDRGADLCAKNMYGGCALLSATGNGHTDTVDLLLRKGADVEAQDADGTTALHCAAANGHSEMVDLLITKGANLDARDENAGTPLHLAAYHGHISTMEFLLSGGANINLQDDVGMSALHWAATKSHGDATKLLIGVDAKLELKNKDGKTPLILVAENGDTDMVRLLLAERSNIEATDANNQTALHLSVIKNHINTVELLLTNGANLEARDEDGNTALLYAARLGHADVADLLITKGADVNARNNEDASVLHWVACNNHLNIAQLFLTNQANLTESQNLDGKTPLMCAAQYGNYSMLDLILSYGADIETQDLQGKSALHWVVIENQPETLELLLSRKAKLDARDKFGRSAFIWSAIDGNVTMATRLLSKGCNVAAKDEENMTALHWAAWNGHQDVVELLLTSATLDVDTRNVYGFNPLLCAVKQGYVEIVKLLLPKTQNVDATDDEAMGVLHWAAWGNHVEILQLLLSEPLDLEQKNIRGKTPLICAAQQGHSASIAFLISKHALVEAQDDKGLTALHWASYQGHDDCVKILLTNDQRSQLVEIKDQEGKTAFIHAVTKGNASTVSLLLGKGADVRTKDNKNHTALHWTAINGHQDVAEVLLAKAPDLDTKDQTGKTALVSAIQNGHLDTASLLLSHGAGVKTKDNQGMAALHYASLLGHTELTQELLEKGSKLNEQDDRGSTALMYAVLGGHIATVKLLLDKDANMEKMSKTNALHVAAAQGYGEIIELLELRGANLEQTDDSGKNGLMHGACTGQVNVVNFFISKGLDIEAKDDDGSTALILASWEGQDEIVKLLLEKGANLDAVNRFGLTALMCAAANGHKSLATTLLIGKADFSLKNKEGFTALDLADKNGHGDIAELIRSHKKGLKDNCVVS